MWQPPFSVQVIHRDGFLLNLNRVGTISVSLQIVLSDKSNLFIQLFVFKFVYSRFLYSNSSKLNFCFFKYWTTSQFYAVRDIRTVGIHRVDISVRKTALDFLIHTTFCTNRRRSWKTPHQPHSSAGRASGFMVFTGDWNGSWALDLLHVTSANTRIDHRLHISISCLPKPSKT